MNSACMRQTRQTRGPAPHAGIPMHAWRATLYARIDNILQAMLATAFDFKQAHCWVQCLYMCSVLSKRYNDLVP